MACKASCGGKASRSALYRLKTAPSPHKLGASSSFFCSTSYHDCVAWSLARTICTRASSGTLNSGERSARASDRSCRGDTSASSRATMSSTSQQSISSVFSPIWAATCRARSSSSKGSKLARLRLSTITPGGLMPLAIWLFIHAAACRASSVLRVSSSSSRGVVKLSRQWIVSGAGLFSSRKMGGSLMTAPCCKDALV